MATTSTGAGASPSSAPPDPDQSGEAAGADPGQHGEDAARTSGGAERAQRAELARTGRLVPPPGLVDAAGWTWRALVVVAGLALLYYAAKTLYLITLPFAAGILLAALVHPLVALLERLRLPRVLAVVATALITLLVIAGVGYWIVTRAISQGPTLVSDASDALGRLPLRGSALDDLRSQVTSTLSSRASDLAAPVVTGVEAVSEGAVGVIIAIFVSIYLLARGERVWDWVATLAPRQSEPSVRVMGPAMWRALGGWVRGTALIAVFHGLVVGVVLLVMGVPLAVSVAVLIFIGSFVPIVGSVVFGALAALLTFTTHGWVDALIIVAVLVVDSQIESHVLQPFLVGRSVHLNALAVVAALTAGSLLWGVAGAILAIPLTAAVHAAVQARRDVLRGREPDAPLGEAADEPVGERAERPPAELAERPAD